LKNNDLKTSEEYKSIQLKKILNMGRLYG